MMESQRLRREVEEKVSIDRIVSEIALMLRKSLSKWERDKRAGDPLAIPPLIDVYDYSGPREEFQLSIMERLRLIKRVPPIGKGDSVLYEATPKAQKLYKALVEEGFYNKI